MGSALSELFVWATWAAWFQEAWHWLMQQVLSLSLLGQVPILLALALVAKHLARRAQRNLPRWPLYAALVQRQELLGAAVDTLLFPLMLWFLIGADLAVTTHLKYAAALPRTALSLLGAWIVIRFTTLFVKDSGWAKFITLAAWFLAALGIMDWLQPAVTLLDQMALQVGNLRISTLLILQGVFSLVLFLWLAVAFSTMMERRIQTVTTLTPSIQVLISKLLKISLITLAVMAALGIIGVDLTAFAVFTGAVGVGVGFGLQKVVSNLISGVILLLDNSVKPGDVITVGDTFGWINSLGARYVSVITRDGREYLIPNEDLITHQVVNWSYSNSNVRLQLPIGVSYRSDVHKAIRLCLEAANQHPRVLKEPPCQCLLRKFGDSSVDLELRFWINDPQNGVASLQSEILLKIWDLFHANGIEIPFPQRDLHLVSPGRLKVALEKAEPDPEDGPG